MITEQKYQDMLETSLRKHFERKRALRKQIDSMKRNALRSFEKLFRPKKANSKHAH